MGKSLQLFLTLGVLTSMRAIFIAYDMFQSRSATAVQFLHFPK